MSRIGIPAIHESRGKTTVLRSEPSRATAGTRAKIPFRQYIPHYPAGPILRQRPHMENMTPLAADILALLRETDTCAVSNAIESFNVRMRNEGYVHDAVRCLFPELPPVAGYAVTGRIRTAAPPIANLCYYHRMDWWEYVVRVPAPRIIVLADVDHG